MSDVDVSVIVGSMNRGDWVASLESVLNQDHPSYEVVLAVDTPEPDREGLAELQRKHENLKIIFNERNLGPAGARNVAARAASGRILAVHDDDDYAVPHRLSRIVAYMDANDVDLVCSYAHWRFVYSDRTMLKRMPLTDEGLKAALERRNCIEHATVAIKAERFRELGGYNETFRYSEDNEFYLRAIRRGLKFGCIDEPLVEIFFGESRITTGKRKVLMLYSLAASLLHNAEQQRTDRVPAILARFALRFFMPSALPRLRRKLLARFGRHV